MKNIHEEKEAECIDDTLPHEMEEGVYDKNNNKNEKYDEGKVKAKHQFLRSPQCMKIKE